MMKIKHDAQGPRTVHECEDCNPPQNPPLWIKSVNGEETRKIAEVAFYAGPNEAYVLLALNSHEELKKAARGLIDALPENADQKLINAVVFATKTLMKVNGI